jgi:hypothetical protein
MHKRLLVMKAELTSGTGNRNRYRILISELGEYFFETMRQKL